MKQSNDKKEEEIKMAIKKLIAKIKDTNNITDAETLLITNRSLLDNANKLGINISGVIEEFNEKISTLQNSHYYQETDDKKFSEKQKQDVKKLEDAVKEIDTIYNRYHSNETFAKLFDIFERQEQGKVINDEEIAELEEMINKIDTESEIFQKQLEKDLVSIKENSQILKKQSDKLRQNYHNLSTKNINNLHKFINLNQKIRKADNQLSHILKLTQPKNLITSVQDKNKNIKEGKQRSNTVKIAPPNQTPSTPNIINEGKIR